MEGALRNIDADLSESLRTQHFAQLGRARLECIACDCTMAREPDLRMPPLYCDPHFDWSKLRRIHLQFRAVQIGIDHPGHTVGNSLAELGRIKPRRHIEGRR